MTREGGEVLGDARREGDPVPYRLPFWGRDRISGMIADLLSTYGALILAAMGVIVSVIPNLARRIERWWWVAAFLIFGAAVSTANYYELHSSNKLQTEMWENTGGDNFCYFSTEAHLSGDAPFLTLKKSKPNPLFDVDASIWKSSQIPNAPDEILAHYAAPLIAEETLRFNTKLEEGQYVMRILTRTRTVVGFINVKNLKSHILVSGYGSWMLYGQTGAIPMPQAFSFNEDYKVNITNPPTVPPPVQATQGQP